MRSEFCGMKILSFQEHACFKINPIYTKVNMTTYATCTLGQFTEEEGEGEEEDRENSRCTS